MELNNFNTLTQEEMMSIDGGILPFVLGFIGGAVVDGVVKATTGKSAGDHAADFIKLYNERASEGHVGS